MRKLWMLVGGLVLLTVVALALTGSREPELPDFGFLSANEPLRDVVFEGGWGAHPKADAPPVIELRPEGGPRLLRVAEYSFQADYYSVVRKAHAEIQSMGGSKHPGQEDSRWNLGSVRVIISEGRFDPARGSYEEARGWVLVRVFSTLGLGPGGYLIRAVRGEPDGPTESEPIDPKPPGRLM